MHSEDLQQQALPQEQDAFLKAEIDHLGKLYRNLEIENHDLKKTVGDLSFLLLQKTRGIDSLKSQVHELIREKDRISEELSIKFAEIENWEEKYIELEQKFERSQQEIKQNRRFIEEQTWSSNDDLKSAHISLLSENERLHNELILKSKELEGWRTKKVEFGRELKFVEKVKDAVTNNRALEMDTRLTLSLIDLDRLHEKLDFSMKENSELQLQVKKLEEKLSELESSNERSNTLLIEKQKEIDSLKSRTS